MRRQQARRQKNKTKSTPSYHAGIFNELKTIDLVDPGSLDVKHNRYLMTVRDDCTGWVETYPVKSKEADVTAVALIEDARRAGKFADAYRTDSGSEWKGRFDQELASRLVPCFKGLPYRPTTDSRHERWHATLQPGVRSNLLQSGLPYRYYGMAAEHFTYCFNRAVHTGKNAKTAYERRFGSSDTELARLHPFGCRTMFFKNEEHRQKYSPTSSEGILVGMTSNGYKVLDLAVYDATAR